MGNMSYCRFQNTLQDLRDCVDALHDITYDDEELPSQPELDAMDSMEVQCRRYLALLEEFRADQERHRELSSEHPEG